MSRNARTGLKNPSSKLILKTIYKPFSKLRNELILSPYNDKNNIFCTNENIGKERYTQTQYQSKQMSRNNSNKNDLLFKSNLKKSFSISKTNCNSLMISKQLKSKDKKSNKNNKIFKILLKESNKNNNNKGKGKNSNSKNILKNKSCNNIRLTQDKNIINNSIKIKAIKNNNKNLKNDSLYQFSNNENKNININFSINNSDKINKNKNPYKINPIKIIFSNSNKNRNNNIKNNFHKTCINTPIESNRKKEQITQLTKELQNKSNQINNLKLIVEKNDERIKNLEEKINSLTLNQKVDTEYEKYSEMIIVKSIKNLTKENENLNSQLNSYKAKEKKMKKLIQKIKNSGVNFDEILSKLNSENENNNINSKNSDKSKYDDLVIKTDTTNNTNITNNTFLAFNLNEEQKTISYKSCINLQHNVPQLPLKNINDYFNENYLMNNINNNTNNNNSDNIQIHIDNNFDCNILQK